MISIVSIGKNTVFFCVKHGVFLATIVYARQDIYVLRYALSVT